MENEYFPMARRQTFECFMQGFGIESGVGIGFGRFELSFSERVDRPFLANAIAHKPGGLVMGDAIEPGAKGLGNLKGFQPAKGVQPNLLVQVERVVGVWDETAQIIEQRFFVASHEANEGVSIARLGFGHPERFF